MNVKFRRSSGLSKKEINKQYQKELNDRIKDLVPSVYAAIALALFRDHGWTHEMISELFAESEDIWGDLDTETMINMCERETGILLKAEE